MQELQTDSPITPAAFYAKYVDAMMATRMSLELFMESVIRRGFIEGGFMNLEKFGEWAAMQKTVEKYLALVNRMDLQHKIEYLYFDGRYYMKAFETETVLAPMMFLTFYSLDIILNFRKDGTQYVSRHGLESVMGYAEYRASRPKIEEIDQKTYLLVDQRNGFIKIGKSIDPASRERTLQSEVPQLKLIYVINKDVESELHAAYKAHRVRGEYFNLSESQVLEIAANYEAKKVNRKPQNN